MSLSQIGCVEPFEPDTPSYDNNLVVEGQILEGKVAAVVRLSRSFALNGEAPVKLQNALVGIRDDQGEQILLSETEAGVYQSDTNEYAGIPGRSYQLFFEIEGASYESSWMLMKKGADISEVYWQLEEQLVGNDSTEGVQFYLNTSDPEGRTVYYRWEYTETWEFLVPHPALGLWNQQTSSPDFFAPSAIPAKCWRMDTSSQIILATTEALSKDEINDFPFLYVSNLDNQLRNRYSLLIKQYSISEETYRFYEQVKNSSENLGTLFDPIPREIIGNIRNINNPDETVLGYFSADGYDSRRVFIDRSEVLNLTVPNGFPGCEADTLLTGQEMLNYINQGGAFVLELFNFDGSLYGYLGAPTWCTDCRLSGTREEPNFWE